MACKLLWHDVKKSPLVFGYFDIRTRKQTVYRLFLYLVDYENVMYIILIGKIFRMNFTQKTRNKKRNYVIIIISL